MTPRHVRQLAPWLIAIALGMLALFAYDAGYTLGSDVAASQGQR